MHLLMNQYPSLFHLFSLLSLKYLFLRHLTFHLLYLFFNFSDTLSFTSLIFVSAFTVPTYPNPLNVNVNTVPITTNFFLKSILHFFSLIFYGHTTQLIISIALITTSSYYKNMTF